MLMRAGLGLGGARCWPAERLGRESAILRLGRGRSLRAFAPCVLVVFGCCVVAANFGLVLGYAPSASAASLVAWGQNDYGQVSTVPTGNDYTAVAASQNHALALKQDGGLVSWGYDGS